MSLDHKHVAILVEDGYQELELHYPRLRMLEAGLRVSVVGAGQPEYASAKGYTVKADRDDMVNAGADWRDEEVVQDGNLISSRTPDDLPAFCRALLDKLG
ncbi:MAG: DJ-1/PfpI family protein [Thioalkalivibrio sp.]|nr:DJ-1/PfpI family protein [Thioalkalivibrio sp.]